MHIIKRTATCGELRADDAGKTVVVNGWVDAKRDHGGVSFINVRDRYGLVQLVAASEDAETDAHTKAALAELHNEYCVAASGVVRKRPPSMVKRDMPT
jgi:aspartyl-tRNA synthetase